MGGKQRIPKNGSTRSQPVQAERSKQSAEPDVVGAGRTGGTLLPMNQRAILRMQHQQGNNVTQRFLAGKRPMNFIQRVPVRESAVRNEVLNNEIDATTGQFLEHTYGVSAVTDYYEGAQINYDLTRQETPAKVVVTVRIKFVSRFGSRETDTPPQPVPEGMHPFIRTVCRDLVNTWNTTNRFELVGRPERTGSTADAGVPLPGGVPTPAAGGTASTTGGGPAAPGGGAAAPASDEIHLPLEFRAEPVLDLSQSAHTTVLFDATTVAGSTDTAVVDSAHWFRNRSATVYPASDANIYAHEYGHLLGIQDEYSLSNPQAHNILHQVSPNPATRNTMDALLDRAGLREVILSALAPALNSRVTGLGAEVAQALRQQQNAMARSLASGLRSAWRAGGVLDAVQISLVSDLDSAGGQERAIRNLRRVLDFEALRNLSEVTIAREVVPQQLDPAMVQSILTTNMQAVTRGLPRPTVNIPYTNEHGAAAANSVTIELASGVGAAGTPLAAAAQQAATAGVGTPAPAGAGPAGAGHTPVLYPSNTLLGRLTALPGRWRNIGQALESTLSEMPTAIQDAVTAQLAITPLAPQVNNNIRQLYQALYRFVETVSRTTVGMTVRNFLTSQIVPEIEAQVGDMMAVIEGEVAAHHMAEGTGTNAAPSTPPDPQLMAAAQQMRVAAEALMNPPTSPAAPGAAPSPVAQNVRFTFNNQMGDNNVGQTLRADQLSRVAVLFNGNRELRRSGEGEFTVRSR